jgi:hypothetical protein
VHADEDRAGDRDPPVPHSRLVDAVEELLHPAQRADEDEPDGQEQHTLGADELADELAHVAERSGDQPEEREGDDERRDRQRADESGDEVRTAVGAPVPHGRVDRHAPHVPSRRP